MNRVDFLFFKDGPRPKKAEQRGLPVDVLSVVSSFGAGNFGPVNRDLSIVVRQRRELEAQSEVKRVSELHAAKALFPGVAPQELGAKLDELFEALPEGAKAKRELNQELGHLTEPFRRGKLLNTAAALVLEVKPGNTTVAVHEKLSVARVAFLVVAAVLGVLVGIGCFPVLVLAACGWLLLFAAGSNVFARQPYGQPDVERVLGQTLAEVQERLSPTDQGQ